MEKYLTHLIIDGTTYKIASESGEDIQEAVEAAQAAAEAATEAQESIEAITEEILERVPNAGAVYPEMYGAVGDGVHDDGPALKAALESEKPVVLTQDLYIKSKVEIYEKNVNLDGRGYTLHLDGTNFHLLRPGNTLSRDHFILFASTSHSFDSPEDARESDLPIIQYTEAGTWQDIAKGENYHRGYISYMGQNPTEGQEEYEAFDKIRGWDVNTALIRNVKMECTKVDGLMILRLTRMSFSVIDNVSIKSMDAERYNDASIIVPATANYDASTGIYLEQAYNVKIHHYHAENFTALNTAGLWSGGYGILAAGTDVTISDSTFVNCKHPLDPGGSFDHWCTGFVMTNCQCHVNELGRIRTDGGRQYQQQIDVHPAMQDIIIENIYISWTDNRTAEQKAENGIYTAAIETEGRKAHLRNVFVDFKPNQPWERLFITTSRQGGEVWYENVKAPTCWVVTCGFRYNMESGQNTYYAANYLTEWHMIGCDFGSVTNGDSSVRVYMDRCVIHYFTAQMAHLRATRCKFINDHFASNTNQILMEVLDDCFFDGCEFYGAANEIDNPMPLITAPQNKAHLHNCAFYMQRGGKIASNTQNDMSGNYAEDRFALELGHLVSRTLQTDEETVAAKVAAAQEYSPSANYVIGDFAKVDGYPYRCIEATTGTWNRDKWSTELYDKRIISDYNPASRYAVGSCCLVKENPQSRFNNPLKDYDIWMCIAAITVAEELTSAHWERLLDYDKTADYAVGKRCFHQGRLYACTSAISGGEDWNASHWQDQHRILIRNVLGDMCELGKTNLYKEGEINGVQFI